MLDERTGCALQTRDERMFVDGTKIGVILSPFDKLRVNSTKWSRKISIYALCTILLTLSACTDYEAMIDDEYEQWLAEQEEKSSSSGESSEVDEGTSSSIEQSSNSRKNKSSSSESPKSSSSQIITSSSNKDSEPAEKTSSSSESPKSSSSSAKSSSSKTLQSSSSQKKTSSSSSSVVDPVEESSSSSSMDPEPAEGTLTDSRDGQTYKTVKIGDQVWMAENLNYKSLNSFCYNDDDSYCSKYGRLYIWSAATVACPDGWHLPSQEEWELLLKTTGDSTGAGKILKSAEGWRNNSDNDGTDGVSFSALPAGYRSPEGHSSEEGSYANFWSSTEYDSANVNFMFLNYSMDNALVLRFGKYYGASVRCLRGAGSSVELPSGEIVRSSDVKNGAMIDSRDGQTYNTVTIGSQTWMAENLNYALLNSHCYNNEANNCTKYGRLYTFGAVMDSAGTFSTNGVGCGNGVGCSPTYPVRGICPEGWHLPSNDEWNTLLSAVGGQSVAGLALKSTTGWSYVGENSDAYSFTALPAGQRGSGGSSDKILDEAHFWSSTWNNSGFGYTMYLYSRNDYALIRQVFRDYFFSVRCLKD